MSKKTRMFGKGIATMFFLFIASNNVWAGDTYYRDCDVIVNSPSSVQGLVYVDLSESRDRNAYNYQSSSPGESARVKANFSTIGNTYMCKLFAYPKPGYTVDGFVTKADYLSGKKNNFITWDSGKRMKSGDSYFEIGTPTESEKTESDPIKNSSYSYSAKTRAEFYAIFKPATVATVTVLSPGELKKALLQTGKGEDISDIIVKGAINEIDIQYLRSLAKDRNLIRIDLSGARISEIPESAFASCFSLYEVKLPNTGLKAINRSAFYSCYSLKKITIPSSVSFIANNCFIECYSIDKGF